MVSLWLGRFLPYPVSCRCGWHIYRPGRGWFHAEWDNTAECKQKLPCLVWQPWDELRIKEGLLQELLQQSEQTAERVAYLRQRLELGS